MTAPPAAPAPPPPPPDRYAAFGVDPPVFPYLNAAPDGKVCVDDPPLFVLVFSVAPPPLPPLLPEEFAEVDEYAYEAPAPPPIATTPDAEPIQELSPLPDLLAAGFKSAAPGVPPTPTFNCVAEDELTE